MAASMLSKEAIAGISVAGGAIFLALVCVMVLLYRALAQHRRHLADIEERRQGTEAYNFGYVERSPSMGQRAVLRRSRFLPYSKSGQWGTLDSREDVHQMPLALQLPQRLSTGTKFDAKRRRFSSWKPGATLFGVNRLRSCRLSAVIENPGGVLESTSAPVAVTDVYPLAGMKSSEKSLQNSFGDESRRTNKQWPNDRPGSGAGSADQTIKNQQKLQTGEKELLGLSGSITRPRTSRSKSVSTAPQANTPGNMNQHRRPQLHIRSVSLGSHQPSSAPNAPVPPLPLIISSGNIRGYMGRGIDRSPSRHSISSLESANSSILVAGQSPLMVRANSVQLKHGANREWKNSLIAGPRPVRDVVITNSLYRASKPSGSIRSSMVRYSVESNASFKTSRPSSFIAAANRANRYSLGQYRTIEKSPGSSYSTTGRALKVQSTSTPRRHSKSMVSANGSPAERRRTSVLRDVSGNQITPSRQGSQHSVQASSTRSSDGNPFRWDSSPLPSALKGSPHARRNHKRNNSVRLILKPEILGPRSRSPSPSIMKGIQEESAEAVSPKKASSTQGLGFSNSRSLPRPPSTNTFDPDVKLPNTDLQISSASNLTNSSSAGLAKGDRTNAGKRISALSTASSYNARRESVRYSRDSSIFTIPSFPSPGKITSTTFTTQTPTLSISRPSTDLARPRPLSCDVLQYSQSHRNPQVCFANDNHSDFVFPQIVIPKTGTSEVQKSTTPAPHDLFLGSKSVFNSNRKSYTSVHDSPPCSPKSGKPPIFPEPLSSPATMDACKRAPFHNKNVSLPLISPRGPRAEPAIPLRKHVLTLRRMNSDTMPSQCRADRRYLRLGREASPALLQTEEAEEWGEFESAVGPGITNENKEEKVHEQEAKNVASHHLEEINGELNSPDCYEESSRRCVWELGEKHWEQQEKLEMVQAQRKLPQTPLVKIQAPSQQGTPGSLYDNKGFLIR